MPDVADLVALSAGLFLAGGVVWVLIGALTVPFMDTARGRATMIFSSGEDTKAFGATPRQVLDQEPNVAKLRAVVLPILAGFLLVSGLMVEALAWFGWREGWSWAFWVLAAVALLVLPFWVYAARPFRRSGTAIRFRDVPPFMWVTTMLWLPAIALGAIALLGH